MSRSNGTIILQGITLDELTDYIIAKLKSELDPDTGKEVQDEILTCEQVEEMLGISHQTRIEYTKLGFLKSYSLGGRKRFYKRSEIIDSMDSVEP